MFRTIILAALLCAALPAHGTVEDDPPDPPTARVVVPEGRTVAWAPNPGPQTEFLASSANEVLYGGAAGGGKSAALIALPARWLHDPDFRALVLRRETTQLGNLLDKAQALYPRIFPGATSAGMGAGAIWRFPSGAKVRFNHCKEIADAYDYQGDEFQLVEFDELTHFEEAQYREIRSRVRSPKPGLPRYLRNTSNPGGKGHEWVFRRWGPWLDPEYVAEGLPRRLDPVTGDRLPPARPGQVLWFLPTKEGGEHIVPKGTPLALSRTFIPARLEDNPILMANDPGYEAALLDNDPVRRAQLREGNWLIKPAAGLLFKRAWFDTVDQAPSTVATRVRRWDFAATEESKGAKKDPDWTVGALWARTSDGLYFVEDVVRLRGRPFDVEQTVLKTAEADGKQVAIRIPQDPGSAGVTVADNYIRLLAGYDIRAERETGDKVTRARPASAQAERRNIKLVRGPWNNAWLAEHEAFPDGDHDDQVDTSSGAIAALSQPAFAYVVG